MSFSLANGAFMTDREAIVLFEGDLKLGGLFQELSRRANFKNNLRYFRDEAVMVPIGGLVTSMRRLARDNHISRETLYRMLKKLKALGLIQRIESSKIGTLIHLSVSKFSQAKKAFDAALRPRGTGYGHTGSKSLREFSNKYLHVGSKPPDAQKTLAYLRAREADVPCSSIPQGARAFMERLKGA